MTRRALLLIPLLTCLAAAADPAQEVQDLFTGLAASLSAGNVTSFLAAFDKKMPGYEKLAENIKTLAAQGTVESFVDVVSDEGDARQRKVELDWRIRVKREGDATAQSPREGKLKCTAEKQGKKWRITALEPVRFFE